MRPRTLFCAVFLATAAAFGHAEDFTQTITLVPDASIGGAFSAGWGVTHVEAGAFTDTFTFTPDVGGLVSASVVSIGFTSTTNLDFSAVTINGSPFLLSPTGTFETGAFGLLPVGTPITMVVSGTAGPSLPVGSDLSASFAGTINISPVPETETWALMFAGLAGIGVLMRRRLDQRGG